MTADIEQMRQSTALYRRYHWTVDEFHKITAAGVLTEDDRIELIEGALLERAPIGSGHAGRVNYLSNYLPHKLYGKAIIAVQNPIVLGENSEPQPDIALLRWRDDFYEKNNPQPQDILLIIEVADTTASFDREVKVPLYARHNIAEVWIIDLQKQRVETYRQLVDAEYSEIKHHLQGNIAPVLLPEAVIELTELF